MCVCRWPWPSYLNAGASTYQQQCQENDETGLCIAAAAHGHLRRSLDHHGDLLDVGGDDGLLSLDGGGVVHLTGHGRVWFHLHVCSWGLERSGVAEGIGRAVALFVCCGARGFSGGNRLFTFVSSRMHAFPME